MAQAPHRPAEQAKGMQDRPGSSVITRKSGVVPSTSAMRRLPLISSM